MAGKQFGFFLSSADQVGFEEALRSSGDIVFLKYWPSSRRPEEVDTSQISVMGQEILQLWISRKEDIPHVKFLPVKGRDTFSCDPTFAPVVEFGRCYETSRYIRSGRLYRVDKYWNEDKQLVDKPVEFIEWADRLYKAAKASLTKVEQGFYAGAEALTLRKAGIAFEGLDIEVGAIKD